MRHPFNTLLLGREPVHRQRLRAGSDDLADTRMGIPFGEPKRFVEHPDVAFSSILLITQVCPR